MKSRAPDFKNIPLDIVGASDFGRYPKVSVEQTYNMIISDGFLVDYAGFIFRTVINPNGKGRAAYKSSLLNKMVVVVGNGVYLIAPNLAVTLIGTIGTSTGDVFIAEDNQGNIAICDKTAIWMYNPRPPFNGSFVNLNVNFTPGYIAFHDTRFVSVDLASAEWRLSDPLAPSNNRVFPFDSQHVGEFQTRPDHPVAAFAFPGKGTLLFIIGGIVTQLWVDAGLPLFPYQLQSGVNIDYGTVSSDSIANIDNIVCWVGINDRSGPVILASIGDIPVKISTDGIDFKLNSLTNPQDCHAFMFKQDGHIFYQAVFPTDNFSLTYDFNSKKFFTVTDVYMNYHPAKKLAFFNNTYYFVSLNDGNLYEMSTNQTTYNGILIPRIRITKTFRMPDTAPFVVNNLSFILEQGVDDTAINPAYYQTTVLTTEDTTPIVTENDIYITTEANPIQQQQINGFLPAVDLSISNDGGETFGNFYRQYLNPQGLRKNRFIYYSLGWANEFTSQYRFWSSGRIVAGDGMLSVYQ
jgi:hypothetical protein